MEVTHEQYQEALKTIRTYAPDVFLNVSPMETKNSVPKSDYLVYHQGYFHICSAITGEIKKANVSLEIIDHCEEPLTAKGEFHLQHGSVGEVFEASTVLLSRKEYNTLLQDFKGLETIQVCKPDYFITTAKAEMYDHQQEWEKFKRDKKKRSWIKRLLKWK